MTVTCSRAFLRDFGRLSAAMRKTTDKSVELLAQNLRYPSLRVKKMEPKKLNIWKARVSRGYRMTFLKKKNEIILLGVGPHNRGLGKK